MFFSLATIFLLTSCSAYQVVSNLVEGASSIAPFLICSFFHVMKLKLCDALLTFLEIVEFFIYKFALFFWEQIKQLFIRCVVTLNHCVINLNFWTLPSN